MATSSRRSSVNKAPESVRYYHEPTTSKSKTSVSISSPSRTKTDTAASKRRPTLQRSATTTRTIATQSSKTINVKDRHGEQERGVDREKGRSDKDREIGRSDKDRENGRSDKNREVGRSDKDKENGRSDKKNDNKNNDHKKHGRRNSSFLGSIFGSGAPPRTAECLTCGSDVTRSAKLPCGHRMCNSCLRRIFTMSIKDAQHMPPKCCQDEHIALSHVDHLFDDKFKILWNTKYQEYTTKNRVYCPASGCGQWIKPANMHTKLHGRKYGRCPKCKTKVCTLCNNKYHSTDECPNDAEMDRLVDMARDKGWQRCPACKAMIELKEGCNHMTCRCGCEFCMLCANQWKTCECPWFNRHDPHVLHDRYETRRNDNAPRRPTQTYQQQLDARKRQERADESLARRLQATSISDSTNTTQTATARRARRDTVTEEVFGNRGDHFLNDNYIQSNTSRINATVIGDAAFARRGERESGRRCSRHGESKSLFDHDAGLALNAFGTESMLGLAFPPSASDAPVQPPVRRPSFRQRLSSISSQNGRERIGGWLNRLG
jgi:ariadne-1